MPRSIGENFMVHITRTSIRRLAAAMALALLATACASDEVDSTSSTAEITTTTAAQATSEAADSPTSTDPASNDATDDADSESDSNSTDDPEIEDDGDAEIDLDAVDDDGVEVDESLQNLRDILPFFGVSDVDEVSLCVRDVGSAGDFTLDEIIGSSALIVALLRCSPDEIRSAMAESFAEIDSSSLSANPAQINCGIDTVLQLLTDLRLASADQVLDADDAPKDFIDGIVDECDISEADAAFLLNEA
ncbi:MAG: hypothetical protein ACI81L_002661 [Verrucomicrobiales bacterium]|jgi:hypothetical protein